MYDYLQIRWTIWQCGTAVVVTVTDAAVKTRTVVPTMNTRNIHTIQLVIVYLSCGGCPRLILRQYDAAVDNNMVPATMNGTIYGSLSYDNIDLYEK